MISDLGSGWPIHSGRERPKYSRSNDLDRPREACWLGSGAARGWERAEETKLLTSIYMRSEPDPLAAPFVSGGNCRWWARKHREVGAHRPCTVLLGRVRSAAPSYSATSVLRPK
jgi:hypothetical protein